jgi:hypothetical protein
MTEIIKIKAAVVFDGKKKPITSGFRPTLSFLGKKALCNFEEVNPTPLHPHEEGSAIIKLAWDWTEPCPVGVGATFLALEGEKEVGRGTVIEML